MTSMTITMKRGVRILWPVSSSELPRVRRALEVTVSLSVSLFEWAIATEMLGVTEIVLMIQAKRVLEMTASLLKVNYSRAIFVHIRVYSNA